MIALFRRCALLVLLLIGLPLNAQLYQGEVPVANQTAEARQEALGRALVDVAVKITGEASAARNSTVLSAKSGAERLMQRYEYRQELVRENGQPVAKLYLKATFYPGSINGMLQRAGYAVWGSERPTVAVYLFENGAPIDGDVRSAMQDKALRRGVNLRFPGNISAEEASDPKAASERLGTLSVNALVGVVGQSMWLSDGKTADALSSSELEGTTDRLLSLLAQRFARQSSAAPEQIKLAIQGIQSAAQFSAALDYLSKLSVVKKVQVLGAANNALQLSMTVQGGAERLQLTFESGRTMRLPSVDAVDGVVLADFIAGR